MALLTYTSETMGTLELEDLRLASQANYPRLSQGYHYGASESNVTYPEGMLERIKLKVGNGRYSGLGMVATALDSSTLLEGKRLKAQQAIVQELVESLHENGFPNAQVKQVVVLFNPVKIFVLISDGELETVYMSVNGRSNGSGARKQVDWPTDVPLSSKRSKREYFERQVKKEQKKVDAINKEIEQIEAGERKEGYPGQLEGLKTWQLNSATEHLKWATDGLARNV